GHTYAGLKAPKNADGGIERLLRKLGIRSDQRPKCGLFGIELEAARHDTGNRTGFPVERQRRTHDAGGSAQLLLPKRISQDNRASVLKIARTERPPLRSGNSQQGKEVRACRDREYFVRRTFPSEDFARARPSHGRQFLEALAVRFEFFKITIGSENLHARLANFCAPNRHQTLGIFVRKSS